MGGQLGGGSGGRDISGGSLDVDKRHHAAERFGGRVHRFGLVDHFKDRVNVTLHQGWYSIPFTQKLAKMTMKRPHLGSTNYNGPDAHKPVPIIQKPGADKVRGTACTREREGQGETGRERAGSETSARLRTCSFGSSPPPSLPPPASALGPIATSLAPVLVRENALRFGLAGLI